jgi:hypothetical protein
MEETLWGAAANIAFIFMPNNTQNAITSAICEKIRRAQAQTTASIGLHVADTSEGFTHNFRG